MDEKVKKLEIERDHEKGWLMGLTAILFAFLIGLEQLKDILHPVTIWSLGLMLMVALIMFTIGYKKKHKELLTILEGKMEDKKNTKEKSKKENFFASNFDQIKIALFIGAVYGLIRCISGFLFLFWSGFKEGGIILAEGAITVSFLLIILRVVEWKKKQE